MWANLLLANWHPDYVNNGILDIDIQKSKLYDSRRIMAYLLFRIIFSTSRGRWVRRPEIRLLTPDEYEEQAREETRKALEELREYCRSPVCKPWKMVSRLESPKRYDL